MNQSLVDKYKNTEDVFLHLVQEETVNAEKCFKHQINTKFTAALFELKGPQTKTK